MRNKAPHQRIAILIIGNEVLSGRTREANAWYAAKTLFAAGCKVDEVAIVPDIQARIVTTLNQLRHTYDAVITSGGIGPTHDDITMQCVADAFDVALLEHAQTLSLMADFYGAEALNDGRRRMARLPSSASPIICEKSICPGAKIDNVYVFAGVPSIFESQLQAVLPDFSQDYAFHRLEIEANLPESLYAQQLGEIQDNYPHVEIGSYPSHCGQQPSAKICISGIDEDEINKAKTSITTMIKELSRP